MKNHLVIALYLFLLAEVAFAQDSTNVAPPSPDKYLLSLNIPSDWTVKRQMEGKDYTLTASSSDDELYLYYVQFMDDNEPRPDAYLETYMAQFGLNPDKKEVISRNLNGKPSQLYYANDSAAFGNEKFRMMIFATSINDRNIAAYIIYPINGDQVLQDKIKTILIGGDDKKK